MALCPEMQPMNPPHQKKGRKLGLALLSSTSLQRHTASTAALADLHKQSSAPSPLKPFYGPRENGEDDTAATELRSRSPPSSVSQPPPSHYPRSTHSASGPTAGQPLPRVQRGGRETGRGSEAIVEKERKSVKEQRKSEKPPAFTFPRHVSTAASIATRLQTDTHRHTHTHTHTRSHYPLVSQHHSTQS